ncbi:MAG: hypothetical protein K2H86_01190 [Muribaculaceae bacterium]|nr:hypothetical protein [Muribaculaceae bacterium]
MGYKVLTLLNGDFVEACSRLEQRVAGSGFIPDCIVGIETGGRSVAERMFHSRPHCYTRLQRPSSVARSARLGRLIRLLPRRVCDWLRILEARKLSADFARRCSNDEVKHSVVAGARLVSVPDIGECRHLLVVDDAIDSGVTMAAVVKAISDRYPDVEIMTAVITETDPDAVIKADFSLYDNKTLIRFPWSMDS